MLLFPPQSARQYEDKFRQHYDSFTVANLGEPNRFGQDCYDAAWILALALNNTLTGMVLYAVNSYYMLFSIVHATLSLCKCGYERLDTILLFSTV